MYSFLLTLSKRDAHLALLKESSVVAEQGWSESRDLGRQLFQGIASLLREHGLKPDDVVDFRLKTTVSDNFTSVKIAETVARMYTWAIREAKQTKKEVS